METFCPEELLSELKCSWEDVLLPVEKFMYHMAFRRKNVTWSCSDVVTILNTV